MESRLDRSAIGFNAEVTSKHTKKIDDLLKEVTPQDLVKFGLIPEFVGRVPINVTLEGLDKDALVRILKEPRNALVKQYKKLFEFDGVKLDFEEDAVEMIADKALERKTGARGLRSVMENAMMDVMYRIPSDESITKCVVTKGAVEGTSEPLLIHREAMRPAK